MYFRATPSPLRQLNMLGRVPKQGIRRIVVSDQERYRGQLDRESVQEGVEQFHRNGLVILENAVSPYATQHVLERMLSDYKKRQNSTKLHWNQGRGPGNISQTPPLLAEYLHEEIWANRLGVNIMENIIGPRPQLSFATSNIVLPRTEGRQAVHSDYYCSHFDFPVFLEVNVYLHDVHPGNGATEFWLGTHEGYSKADHSSSITGWIKQDVFTSRAAVSPPVQPSIPRGSLMIRDLRCWHAGRANGSDTSRIILGFMYSPRWFGSHMRTRLPSAAQESMKSWTHIDYLENVEFINEDIDYLNSHQDINLTQTPSDPRAPYVPKHGSTVVTSNDYWTPH